MLSPRAALAILLAPFAIFTFDWALRDSPPDRMPCADAGPRAVREAWVSGVAPAALITGCVCLVVLMRLSAHDRGGRAGAPTLAAVVAWLALAIAWWLGGEAWPLILWVAIAYVLTIPALFVVVGLIAVILARDSWGAVRVLAWLCAVVLVPGLVAWVEAWNADFYC